MGKSLVLFYSFEGNTEFAARTLAKHIGSYIERIVPLKQPPKKGFGKFFWGGKSVFMNERPVLEPLQREITEFDNIIIGFPVWAGSYPPAIASFIKDYPFKGKKVYIIACSAGGNAKKAIAKLTEKLSGNEVIASLSLVDPAKDKEKNKDLLLEFADKYLEKEEHHSSPEETADPHADAMELSAGRDLSSDAGTIEFSEN